MDAFTPFERTIVGLFGNDLRPPCSPQCHPSPEVLLDYTLGELPSCEHAQVETHALRCAECRGRLEALAEGLEVRLRAYCGATPSWSFASWLVRRGARARRSPRVLVRITWATGTIAAAACLGVAVWKTMTPVSELILRGETAGGIPRLALAMYIIAGLIVAAGVVLLLIKRRKR
jgi:anti-sigma factor RsiW